MTSSGSEDLGERREAAQVAEHHRDLAPVAFERIAVCFRSNHLRNLRRQEALQAPMRSISTVWSRRVARGTNSGRQARPPDAAFSLCSRTVSCNCFARSSERTRAMSAACWNGLVR